MRLINTFKAQNTQTYFTFADPQIKYLLNFVCRRRPAMGSQSQKSTYYDYFFFTGKYFSFYIIAKILLLIKNVNYNGMTSINGNRQDNKQI